MKEKKGRGGGEGRRRDQRKGADKERLEVTGLVENGPPCTRSDP